MNSMKPANTSLRQAGAALITSLIFLTVLTILGMSTLGTALLEGRTAGNARDRNLALQAAEIGLRDAELFIRDSGRIVGNIVIEMGVDAGDYSGTACTYGVCYNGMAWSANGTNWIASPPWESETNWASAIQYQREIETTTGKPVGRAAGGTQLAFNAAYVLPVSKLPLLTRQPEYLIETFPLKAGDDRYYYRITVRGYGMRGGTRVMLQEVYTP